MPYLVTNYRKLFDRLGRWSLALLFSWSGIAKLAAPAAFASVISDFGLLPDRICLPAAILLAGGEILLAIALLAGIGRSREVSIGLLVFFIIVLSYGLYMGLDIDCGCFGSAQNQGPYRHGLQNALYRDIAFLLLAILTLFVSPRSKAKASQAENFSNTQAVSANYPTIKEDQC